ncbi:FG-GAP-like repeat-containing protein [Streptomyces blastmyceticus]|uniref:FG-GAP-like repeat-containing protein n=1 Tax=Streptomyces blastmyceticus TaxID=68180 RepID=A0ABN0XPD3_9ACTN
MVVALLTAGFGAARTESAHASPTDWKVPRLAVMPLGDSITEGARSTTNSGYRGELWNRLAPHASSLDFVGSQQHGRQLADRDHEGHSGWRIDELSVNIEKWLAAARPNVVLLHIGANDVDQNYHADTAPDRLGSLIDQITAAAPGVTVLVSSLVPSTNPDTLARIEKYNTAVPKVVEERRKRGMNVGYVSMAEVTVQDLGDWLHPNDGGYVKMANAFYNRIARAAADGWIRERVDVRPVSPRKLPLGDYQVDINGDGRADYLVVDEYGAVSAWLNNGDKNHVAWTKAGRNGRIATGVGASGDQVRFADINGDGRADYLVVDDSGAVHAWLNDSTTGQDKWTDAGTFAPGGHVPRDQVRFADINGDGRADYLVVDDHGAVRAWVNNGAGGHDGWTDAGVIATGVGVPGDQVRFADVNGDRRADYLVVDGSGAVHAWLNDSSTGQDKWTKAGVIATGTGAPVDQVRFADINGDGKADYLTVDDIGVIRAWVNNGGDGHDEWTGIGPVSSAVAPGSRVRI